MKVQFGNGDLGIALNVSDNESGESLRYGDGTWPRPVWRDGDRQVAERR